VLVEKLRENEYATFSNFYIFVLTFATKCFVLNIYCHFWKSFKWPAG